MKGFALLTMSCVMLACTAHAAPTSEQANLALLTQQLNQMESTLQRAEAQARLAPDTRYRFDYSQAFADIHTIRHGIHDYLSPTRSQPRNVTTLSGLYRREVHADER
jgi:RAQPRD family integrative conjugative element protein